MAKDKMPDLRNYLFDQIDRLQDKDLDLEKELKRAQGINSIAKVLIDTAKVEVEFIRAVGGEGSGFIPLETGATFKRIGNGNP